MNSNAQVRRCTVFRMHGDTSESWDVQASQPPDHHRTRTIADTIPIHEVMSPSIICARPDLDVCTVVSLMVRHHVGCIPVVDERRRPIGMITKFDIVEQLDAFMSSAVNGCPFPEDLAARSADEIMMPIAITLDEQATVAHAASMMVSEDTHHVLVVSRHGAVLGVVSSKDIANWIVDNDRLTPHRTDAAAWSA